MGSYLVSVPVLANRELVFDENETRQILKFFYPADVPGISRMTVAEETRWLAQAMLVAAIDGSYAPALVGSLDKTAVRPAPGMRSLVNKLARRCGVHWFKHATQDDLFDARIADSVRTAVGLALASRFRIHLGERRPVLRPSGPVTMYVAFDGDNRHVWI